MLLERKRRRRSGNSRLARNALSRSTLKFVTATSQSTIFRFLLQFYSTQYVVVEVSCYAVLLCYYYSPWHRHTHRSRPLWRLRSVLWNLTESEARVCLVKQGEPSVNRDSKVLRTSRVEL